MSQNPPRDGLLDGEERVLVTRLAEVPGGDNVPVVAHAAARRALIVGGGIVALIAGTYLVPGLSALRPWAPGDGYVPFWNIVGRELLGQGGQLEAEQEELSKLQALAQAPGTSTASFDAPAPSARADTLAGAAQPSAPPKQGQENSPQRAVFPDYPGHPDDDAEPKVPIEFVEGLDHYYRRLTLVEMRTPGVIARAGHWGDSVLANDGITSAIRRRMQARFGDGGHGYHVMARYNLAYHHQGVRFSDRGDWQKCEIIFKCESDGHYGYGGVSARSSGGGTSGWETTKAGIGQKVSRFELWYATLPNGGKFQVKVDGEVDRIVDTRSEKLGEGWEIIIVDEGPHSFEVRAIGDGLARAYGVVLETEGPGVVWDGLALVGSFTQRLDYQDPEHIAAHIKQRDADLLVFLLGGNDVQRDRMDLSRTMRPYEEEYTRVIRKFRAGKPQASCLIMSVTDHAERLSPGVMRTRRVVPKMVASQRKVAEAEGCAFYDTFSAMGGKNSVVRWYRARPPLAGPDLSHPTTLGHEAIAALMYQALMRGYGDFRKRMQGRPFEELAKVGKQKALSPAWTPHQAGPE